MALEYCECFELGEVAFARAAYAGVFAVCSLIARGQAASGLALDRGTLSAAGAAGTVVAEVRDQLDAKPDLPTA